MSLFPDFVRPLVLSGPSGSGKSTLLNRLFSEFPEKFAFSVSHTTRHPRPGELDGKAYHFVTHDKFKALIDQKGFVEHAEFSGNLYGTSWMTVQDITRTGKRCVLDIESQGVRQIKQTTLNPIYLFIAPPSLSALHTRLIERGTESPESLKRRLDTALVEVEYAMQPGVHDIVVVNDDFERAYSLFRRIALGETRDGDMLPVLE